MFWRLLQFCYHAFAFPSGLSSLSECFAARRAIPLSFHCWTDPHRRPLELSRRQSCYGGEHSQICCLSGRKLATRWCPGHLEMVCHIGLAVRKRFKLTFLSIAIFKTALPEDTTATKTCAASVQSIASLAPLQVYASGRCMRRSTIAPLRVNG